MTEVSLADQVLDLVLQVPVLFGIMTVFTVETIVSAPVPFFGSGLDAVRATAAIKWFVLCIFSRTVVGGFSTRDQNSLDGRMPIRKAWMTKEGCASRIAHDSVANLLMNCVRGSSLPWAMLRSEVVVGLGRALTWKFCSSSLASWSKEIMVVGWRRSYHIRAGPLKVVGKTRHIIASDESYNAICARKAATCSVRSELPSYDSKTGSLKLAGIGLSRISGAKGDLCLELSALHSELIGRVRRQGVLVLRGVLDPEVGGSGFFRDNRWGLRPGLGRTWFRGTRSSWRWGLPRHFLVGRGPLRLRSGGCRCLSELRNIRDDHLYHPCQGLYLMREPEESLRGDYLQRVNQGGEPRISEQPPIPVRVRVDCPPSMTPGWGAEGAAAIWGMAAGAGVGEAASLVIRLGIRFEMRSCDMGPPSAKMLGSSRSVTWQLYSFLRAASLSNDVKSCKRPEPSSLGSTDSLRRSSQGLAQLKKGDPLAQIWQVNIYTCVDKLVVHGPHRCYTHHCASPDTPPVASCHRSRGTVRRSVTALALTRRMLSAVRGYCSPIGCRAYPATPLVTSCRGLVWHVGSATPPIDRGDIWLTTGPSEDIPRSGRAEDAGSTWLSHDMAEMRTLCSSPHWT
ncbi:hypothetical protein BHM03_00028396 [Ensete ventricosum]|nr:hypothetical protein BHM03_00028396 [Ensete ventricosum]